MAYYIKEGQSSIFSRIKLCEKECKIPQISSNLTKIERVVKKLKKNKINEVILNNKLKENKEFIKMLNDYDITIIDGKWFMQYMLQNIINYLKEKGKISDIDEITILANDLSNEVRKNIKRFSRNYKRIRIVTNHLEKFKRIEQELYEERGVPIIVTNNKRKALAKATLIVNFDFAQETINQYNINESSTIINLDDKIKINRKRFSGLIITDYEVEFQILDQKRKVEFLDIEDILTKQEEFSLKEILEGKIYSMLEKQPDYCKFEIIEELIKKYDIVISKLYGMNGLIT